MALVSKAFGDIITFERATSGTFFNSAGVLQSAAIDAPRFDYNPSTLAAQGLLIEEQRTNGIRNNTMVGAVAGTPGTLPTNWSTFTALTGLTRRIVDIGTESGITYIDIKLSGTPSAAGDYGIYLETATEITAATGQTWAQSAFLRTSAGSQTGISSITFRVDENTSGGVFVSNKTSSALTVTSTLIRVNAAYTLTGGATVARIMPWVRLTLSGEAIDITLRIGLPQLEQGAFSTSVIPTTTAAVTRSADVASVNTLSPWYNATEGTMYAEWSVPYATTNVYRRVFGLNQGSQASNAIDFQTEGTGTGKWAYAIGTTAAGDQAFLLSAAKSANTTIKAAGAYATNDAAVSFDGATALTDATVTLPGAATILTLGNGAPGAITILSGYLRRITYYPRRLTNAELQAITA